MAAAAEIPANSAAARTKVERSAISAGTTPTSASSRPPAIAPVAIALLSITLIRPFAAGSSSAGTSRGISVETPTCEIAASRPLTAIAA